MLIAVHTVLAQGAVLLKVFFPRQAQQSVLGYYGNELISIIAIVFGNVTTNLFYPFTVGMLGRSDARRSRSNYGP